MSKGKKNSFGKQLKEEKKKIILNIQGEEVPFTKVVESSMTDMIGTSLDGVVPVSVTEVTKDVVENAKGLGVSTSYAQPAWSLYEYALKFPKEKQTLLITAPYEYAGVVIDCDEPSLKWLKTRSNISMLLGGVSEKIKKRYEKWEAAEDGQVPDIFVFRIPNVVLFTENIKKNEPTKVKLFDVVILFVKGEKKFLKLKKKNSDAFKETVDFTVQKGISVLKQFGVSSVHTDITSIFFNDPHEYAKLWGKYLFSDKSDVGILHRVVFSTTDTDTMVQFNSELAVQAFNSID
jgi:hypothetical protein